MTAAELEQILDLATGLIGRSGFLKSFRASSNGQQLCGVLLSEALDSKVPEDAECALLVGFTFGFTLDHLQPLLQLLSEPWHVKHEDIVTALGKIKSGDAAAGLYAATQWVPAYLDFDDSRALAVKAIWALGGLDTSEANGYLHKLATDPDEILSAAARKQLARKSIH